MHKFVVVTAMPDQRNILTSIMLGVEALSSTEEYVGVKECGLILQKKYLTRLFEKMET